jgi:ABC-type multidrug transport system fused ATPase/permease subunit
MDNRLSVGRLITFQLYWNQIQGAYKGIMSVLMSLTRAAGAAQRVLSLVDALPDIDPNAGTMVCSPFIPTFFTRWCLQYFSVVTDVSM